jgi:hypothetical protein
MLTFKPVSGNGGELSQMACTIYNLPPKLGLTEEGRYKKNQDSKARGNGFG